jgi:hypothetical protein
MAANAFTPGAYGIRADYNFVSTMSLHKPDIDPTLTKRFGSQLLSELIMYFGKEKGTSSLQYTHYEEDRVYPKINATATAGAAGAAVTFTLSASSLTVPQNASPYVGAPVNVTAIPVRVGDILMIKPSSGIVTSTTVIQALVTGVNAGAGTFIAYPTISGTNIPTISPADEVVILSSAFGEGSNQPEPLNSTVTAYTNQLQIIRETFRITGTEQDIVTWVEFEDPTTGKKGYGWKVKGEADTYKRYLIKRENALLMGSGLTNVTLADVMATAGTPTSITEGLSPAIDARGNLFSYSSITGVDLNLFENIVKTLEVQKGAKVNMLLPGINLSLGIDGALADRVVNGGVSYGNFNMSEDAAVNFAFKSFAVGGYTFHKKVLSSFSDLQTYGAAGFNFNQEALIIPMDNQMDAKTREEAPSLRMRYLVGPDGNSRKEKTAAVDMFQTGDSGQDYMEMRYLGHWGLEAFALNRFSKISLA